MAGTAMTQIPEHYPIEYATNWEMLAQQKESRLRNSVTIDSEILGKSKKYNQMGEVEFSPVNARAQETQPTDVPLEDRWIRPYPHDVTNRFDEWDEKFLGKIVLPKSELVMAHGSAYGRLIDQTIIDAAVGVAYTGEIGITPVSLPASQILVADYDIADPGTPTGTPTQISIDKLIAAKGLFGTNEVDEDDPITFWYNQHAMNILLLEAKVTSRDFAAFQALMDGTIKYFLGMNWVRTEKLPLNSSGYRQLVVASKSGLTLATTEKTTHMDILPTKSHALQVRSVTAVGAVRKEEKKVVVIECDETAALPS